MTTTQGIELFSNAGARRYYRGVVRNVEQTDEVDLPEAVTRIADVDAKSPERFLARLKKQSCMLLHLSEGVDETARKHFRALKLPSGEWAITSRSPASTALDSSTKTSRCSAAVRPPWCGRR